jgi:hypothetical protein
VLLALEPSQLVGGAIVYTTRLRTVPSRMGRSHWIAIQNPLPDESLSSRTTRPVLFSRRVVKFLRILMTNSTWELGVIRLGDSSRMPPVLTFFVQTRISWIMSLLPNFKSVGQYRGKR